MNLSNRSVPCRLVEELSKQVLSGVNLEILKLKEFLKHILSLSYDAREFHFNTLFQRIYKEDQLVLKYPLKRAYLKHFFKRLLQLCEADFIDCSQLYELYVELLEDQEESPFYFKHFFVNNKVVIIKENNKIISEGTTGLVSWQGGIALAEWCLNNSEEVNGKHILELGCGVGLTGLCISSSHCRPKSYCFTDCHDSVIEILKQNITINFPDNIQTETKLSVFKLDWEYVRDFVCNNKPQLVLAAVMGDGTIVRNYLKRPGQSYRQYSSESVVTASKYFTNVVGHRDKTWIPPRSPYALIQEDLYSEPWQLLIATIFLTKTSAERAIPQVHKFLLKFPRPEDVLRGEHCEIRCYLTPLGLDSLRTDNILKFSQEYLEKDWSYPIELHGIGKYGNDSFRMFCINEWRHVSPDDIPLTMYRNWLIENAESLGL